MDCFSAVRQLKFATKTKMGLSAASRIMAGPMVNPLPPPKYLFAFDKETSQLSEKTYKTKKFGQFECFWKPL